MKKRLLITSIVMMLVCAVALSTATYAWFTSNTSVSASTMTLKAATSDGSALGIGWTGDPANTFISSAINEILNPMAPNVLNWDATSHSYVAGELKNNVSTYEMCGIGNQKFYTSDIKTEQSLIQFGNEGENVQPVVYSKTAADAANATPSGAARSFYIKNLSTANVLDKIIVSGVFTETSSNDRYLMVNTTGTPDPDQTYYFRNGENTYSEVTDADLTFLQTRGFDNTKTYYIKESLYVLTKDTVFKEDTKYYTRTGAGTNESPYVYTEYTTQLGKVIGAGIAANTYYEYRSANGDDMLRIAIFTKEYRYTQNTSAIEGKKYYWTNPDSGIVEEYTVPVEGNPKALKLLEVTNDYVTDISNYYIPTSDPTVQGGKTYYTYDGSNYSEASNPQSTANLYEKIDERFENHKLLGVLAKNATVFTKASSFDMNEVYFEADEYEVDTSVTEENIAEKVLTGLYVRTGEEDNYTYTKATTWDGSATYCVAKTYKQKLNITTSEQFASGVYYTAENTAVNGAITTNKNVNGMYYYSDVTTSLELAADLQPGELVDIVAVVWLDGTELDDSRSDQYAQVSLKFDSVRENHQSNNLNPSTPNN